MATAHNRASKADIAKVVLMPGDPLRAKYLAEMYLTDVTQFNDVRNMFGYTGMYEGKRISVMGSGMGCGSIGIYAHELYHKYDVEVILRVGTCGAYSKDIHILDVLLVTSSYSASAFAQTYSGDTSDIMIPDEQLTAHIEKCAYQLKIPIQKKRIHTSDCFYHILPENLQMLVDEKHCVGVDMESFALFHTAQKANKKAGCLLMVSDHMMTKEKLSVDMREKGFDQMMKLALQSVSRYA